MLQMFVNFFKFHSDYRHSGFVPAKDQLKLKALKTVPNYITDYNSENIDEGVSRQLLFFLVETTLLFTFY